MNTRERVQAVFLYGVFICYILVLIKILFLSRISIWDIFNSQRTVVRSINLVPFQSISEYILGGSADLKRFAMGNVMGNILIFIPFGVYLSLFKNNKRRITPLLLIFIVSLLVEIIQGLLAIGAADVDDILLNSLGGWIGIVGYKSLRFIFRDDKKVRAAITVLSAIVGIPATYFLLFMIQMRF